jgi:hypothetical protein
MSRLEVSLWNRKQCRNDAIGAVLIAHVEDRIRANGRTQVGPPAASTSDGGLCWGDVPGVFEGTVLQNAKTKVDHRKRTCSERKPPAGTWQSLAWRQRNEITSALGNDSARKGQRAPSWESERVRPSNGRQTLSFFDVQLEHLKTVIERPTSGIDTANVAARRTSPF